MNLLTIIIVAVLILFAVWGFQKGMVKKLAGIVALAASWFLVSAALPYITDFLVNQTPVYSFITAQCETVVSQKVSETFLKQVSTSEGQENSGIDREQVKSLLDQYGMDSSVVDTLSDAELQNLVAQYFQEYQSQLQSETTEESGSSDLLSMTKIQQTELIKNLPLPSFLKDLMLNYNNSEGYSKLNVTDFQGYVVNFFARIILNIVAFLLTLIVVQILLWTLLSALNLFARLPVLNLINRLGGLAIGGLQGLLLVWLFFLVVSLCAATDWGSALLNMINGSEILKNIYDSNMFLKMTAQAMSNFM